LLPLSLLLTTAHALSSSARAESSFELVYDAANECVDEAGFRQLVARQLGESRDANARANRARVRVWLGPAESDFRASFELTLPDGTSSLRELRAKDCAEAAPALAFVLALALDGREAGVSAEPSPTEAAATVAPPTRTLRPTQGPAPAARLPSPQKPPAASGSAYQLSLGADIGARGGLAPSTSTVEGGFVALRRSPAGAAPWRARLSFLRALPVWSRESFGTTEFSWWAVRGDLCPLELSPASGVRLLPFVGAHVGKLAASGSPNPAPNATGRARSTLWADVAGGLLLEISPLEHLSLVVDGGAVLPLTRPRFVFDATPEKPVYRPPPFALSGFLGLALHFP
jgi:hypothetical protein